MQRNRDLTTGNVPLLLLRLALPMVGGMFAIVAYNVADAYFVSQYGADEVAALAYTFPVVMFVGGLAIGLGIGASSVISRHLGANKTRRVRRLATHALLLALAAVILVTLGGIATLRPVFGHLGAKNRVLDLVCQYMVIWYVGMVFLVVPMVGNNIIRATGDTLTPALIMSLGAVINVILDWVLIFGRWGLPEMGIRGAALATVIGRGSTLTVSLAVLHFRKGLLEWKWPRPAQLWASWRSVIYVGLPAAATHMLAPISVAVLTRIASGFGKAEVASLSPGPRIEALAGIPGIALAVSVIPFVGQNWGAGRLDRVKRGARSCLIFCFFWGLFVAIGQFLFAGPIAAQFEPPDQHDLAPQIVRYLALFLRIVPLATPLALSGIVISSILNGMNRPLQAAALNVARLLVFMLPLVYLGSRIGRMRGFFAGVALANALFGLAAILYLRALLRRPRHTAYGPERGEGFPSDVPL